VFSFISPGGKGGGSSRVLRGRSSEWGGGPKGSLRTERGKRSFFYSFQEKGGRERGGHVKGRSNFWTVFPGGEERKKEVSLPFFCGRKEDEIASRNC